MNGASGNITYNLDPFTSYTLSISTSNSVGSSPPKTITFVTPKVPAPQIVGSIVSSPSSRGDDYFKATLSLKKKIDYNYVLVNVMYNGLTIAVTQGMIINNNVGSATNPNYNIVPFAGSVGQTIMITIDRLVKGSNYTVSLATMNTYSRIAATKYSEILQGNIRTIGSSRGGNYSKKRKTILKKNKTEKNYLNRKRKNKTEKHKVSK
jgi:hypothetical protein